MSCDPDARLARLTALFDAIMAKTTGRQVTQASHNSKQTSFQGASLTEMIRLYRQLWYKESCLPQLDDVGQPFVKRGPVMRFHH